MLLRPLRDKSITRWKIGLFTSNYRKTEYQRILYFQEIRMNIKRNVRLNIRMYVCTCKFAMIWCNVVWCDIVWYDIMYSGMVWYGVVIHIRVMHSAWYDMKWCGMILCGVVCLFVFESDEQFFSYLMLVTFTGDKTANLDLCLALITFSCEGSFTCHTYCDTGP
jgi:hypothetical protein